MEFVFLGIAVVCLGLMFLMIRFSRNLEKEDGRYLLDASTNGGPANRFFQKHPEAKGIFNILKKNNKALWSENTINELIQSGGAKAVIASSGASAMIIITKEMALAVGNTARGSGLGEVYDAKHRESFLSRVSLEPIKTQIAIDVEKTAPKQRSVVGSAVAGAVIAGGVGAVVGAVAAASNNIAGKEKTTIKYAEVNSEHYISYFNYYLCTGRVYLNKFYLADDVKLSHSMDTEPTILLCDIINQVW